MLVLMLELVQTSTVGDHLYLADRDDNGNIRHIGSHLACFMAGNWLFGKKLCHLHINEGLSNVFCVT